MGDDPRFSVVGGNPFVGLQNLKFQEILVRTRNCFHSDPHLIRRILAVPEDPDLAYS